MDKGNTPMIKAAAAGRSEAVRTLLQLGADVGETNLLGDTALTEAACQGHAQVVRQLFEKGANLNAQTSFGNTALLRGSFIQRTCQ